MNLRVATTVEQLQPLRTDWNRLAALNPRDGAFRTFDWVMAWFKTQTCSAVPHVFVARDANGEVVGIAPLFIANFADHRMEFRALGFGGRDVVSGDFLDVLCADEIREEFWNVVLQQVSSDDSWDLAICGELLEHSVAHTAVKRWCEQGSYTSRVQERRVCPFIELPQKWDEYLSSRGANFRSNLRKLDRLKASGVEVNEWTNPADLQREMETLVALHTLRWNSKGEPGSLSRPVLQHFLKELCKGASKNAIRPHMFSMRLDGQTIASLLTFRFASSTYYYQAGWDTETPVAKLRPMLVLLGYSIQRAIEDHLEHYELLRGEHDYKLRFADSSRQTVTVLAARSARARAYVAALKTSDRIKRYIRPKREHAMAAEGGSSE